MIKEKMIVNDELYNYFMRHLTEKILINFKGKNSISESIDDYLQDLDYIMNYNFINEINKIELISEIDEIKLLDQNIQEMIEKLNGENFKNKKELIENILDYELDLQNDLNSSINNKKSLNDTIYIHQPISYDEEMIRDQLNIDFPIKKKNEFFSKLQINDLFNQESIKIIKSKDPNMKNLIQKKDDFKMTKEIKNIVNLLKRFLSIIEDERQSILLLLGI
ncbi:transmembrane protein [Cryptosporidium hominis TU502]|uniref:transmembrane protein n=1 Tax=Cryptosporidium hominis (strain TU502) TaxID=353151 RepID=UPI0000452CAC|nr:transmembrane protein [Cryptosporidium hominis TU502]